MTDAQGRIRALVTGGSGAIGAAVCRRLAAMGHHVIVHANGGPDRARMVADEIVESGGTAEVVVFDVADAAMTASAMEGLLADAPIQVVVSNAGVHDDAPFAGMSAEQWRHPIDVSLHGFFNVVRPALLPMMRTRWGRVIAVSSIAGILGNRGQANYAAAKAGLHGAVRSISQEVASRGVTVNAVAPGVVETEATLQSFPPDRIKSFVPMKRAGKPEEIAEVIGFLASPGASYLTGQIIAVDGGIC